MRHLIKWDDEAHLQALRQFLQTSGAKIMLELSRRNLLSADITSAQRDELVAQGYEVEAEQQYEIDIPPQGELTSAN